MDVVSIARQLEKRTASAVTQRARRLKLPMDRNTISLWEFIRRSGLARTTIINTAERLGFQLSRAPRTDPRQNKLTNMFLVTYEQRVAILQFFLTQPKGARVFGHTKKKTHKGMWGVGIKPPSCYECGTSERPHFARGFCKRCYHRILKSRKSSPWEEEDIDASAKMTCSTAKTSSSSIKAFEESPPDQ
jgi:hypothetical protein